MKSAILAVAVAALTLTALPSSERSVEPTLSLRIARAGLIGTPLSYNDAGVLEVKQILDAVQSHPSADVELLTEMQDALMARYGDGSVTTQALGTTYSWDYDPDDDLWIWICSSQSVIAVQDDGQTPVLVRANFRVTLASGEAR